MSDTTPAPSEEIGRFPSLAAMSAMHRDLLKRHRKSGDTSEITADIEHFILRGRATGALLDDEDDRWVAQGLLDYWTTKVYRTGYEPPDGTLEDFDPNLAPELPDDLCPYVGLDAFRESESDVFFGRMRLVDTALNVLKENRLLAIVGASGSGKSSLALAGVLPKLKGGALPGSERWRYFKPILPGAEPLHDLAHLIQPDGSGQEWIEPQAQALLRSPSELTLQIEKEGSEPAVVIIDHFEEIFILRADETVRQAFINNVIGLAESPHARHIVIIIMRADFVSHVARLPKLRALFDAGQVTVPALNASELRDIIVKPAELIGLKFEEGLVEELVGDVLGEPAALPLLQFTLLKLWEHRERNRLTWTVYRKMGGGRKALAYAADEFYNSLPSEDQAICKRIFLRIVRPGEGLEVTSSRVLRDSLYRAGEPRERVDRILDRLLQARLLRQIEGDSAHQAQIEVAHDALVRNWPLLVEWLDEERANLRNRLRLTAAAKQWKQLGREKGALLRGVMLHIAESYDDLSDLEREFIEASREAAEAARKQKEAARQRELEQAQALAAARQRELEQAEALTIARERELNQAKALAEEQTRRADMERERAQEQAKTAQQLRRRAVFLTAALVFVAVFAFATLGFARQSTANANQAALNAQAANEQAATANAASTEARANELAANEASNLAIAQQQTAQAASTQAVAQQSTAIAERNIAATAQAEAERQANIAFSRQLAAQALNYFDLQPDLTLLLSVEALGIHDTLESKNTLLLGLQRSLNRLTVPVGAPLLSKNGYIYRVAFNADGKTLASGSNEGVVVLWNVAQGSEIRRLTGHRGSVLGLAFDPSGKTLASASSDGTVILWDVAAGALLFQTPQSTFGAYSVAFNPSGATMAVGRNNGSIELWDVASRTKTNTLTGHLNEVWSVAFSPDGSRLASAGADSTARVWDPLKGTTLLTLKGKGGHTRAIRSIVWSPNGKLLATASQDSTVVIWDSATGLPIAPPLTDHTNQVFSLAFSRDGQTLASGSADRSVILWDVNTLRPIDQLRDHSHWVMAVAFSPDGKTLASGSIDESIVLREVVAQQQLLGSTLSINKGPVQSVLIDSNLDALVAARPANGSTSLWNITTNTRLAQPGAYQSAAISLDGSTLALGDKDGKIILFNIADNKAMPVPFESLKAAVLSLAFSADGATLASSTCGATDVNGFCTANMIQVWEAATGKQLVNQQTGHADSILSLAFSPDGKLLATGSQDKTVALWDIAAGQPVGVPLTGHGDKVTSLAFSPDGATLASGSADSTFILWDVATRQPFGRPFSGHAGAVTALAFSPTGTNLLSGGSDGTLMLWTVSLDAWERRACEVAQRNLTHTEWTQFLATKEGGYRKTCEQWPEGQ